MLHLCFGLGVFLVGVMGLFVCLLVTFLVLLQTYFKLHYVFWEPANSCVSTGGARGIAGGARGKEKSEIWPSHCWQILHIVVLWHQIGEMLEVMW